MSTTRLVWLVFLAVLMAGCGSYSASPSGNGGRLTKAEWISAADDICTRSRTEGNDLAAPESVSALVVQLESLIRIFSREVDDLETLTPVPAEEANAAAVVAASRLQLTLAKELKEVASTGDTAAIQSFTAANQAKVQEASKVASAYGLKVCGSAR